MKKAIAGCSRRYERRSLPVLILLGLLAGISLWGCRSVEPAAMERTAVTESGLEYQVTRQGRGNSPEYGDIVRLHYTGKLEDGSVFDSSRERDEPIVFRVGSGQVIPGLEEGISLVREGGRITLIIPPDLGYGDRAMGPVPANATLTFDVELLEITKPEASLDVTGVERTQLRSGVEYAVVQQGNGKPLEAGMRVSVHYTGYLEEDESMFDSSHDRGRPIQFVLGRGMVIPGWEEGLMQLRVGDKARLYIPYEMAYGESGRGPIPPRANLIFDVEVVDAQEIAPPRPFEVNGLDTLSTESGLQYIMVAPGNGEQPVSGQVLTVHYSGYLTDGSMFDSSVQRGEPFRFVLGQGQVIRGWDEGFALLSKGAKARLIVPPHLGYGDRDMGVIPPGSTLVLMWN
jgi:peptidylprolyl isomerase